MRALSQRVMLIFRQDQAGAASCKPIRPRHLLQDAFHLGFSSGSRAFISRVEICDAFLHLTWKPTMREIVLYIRE